MKIKKYIYPRALVQAALFAFFTVLSGCSGLINTAYEPPKVTLPAQWTSQTAEDGQGLAPDKWWQVFKDQKLNQLIEKALKTNNDMASAAIKVRKAQLEARLSGTELTPDLSISGSGTHTKDLKEGASSKSFGTTMELSWEADLWGKLASARDSAEWEAKATQQDLANTALSLVGTTADLYWQIAYLNQAIQNSRDSIAYTLKTLDIVKVKYDAGDISQLDLLQAEQDVESQKADLSDYLQQMTEAKNSLAILFNQPPGPVMANPGHLTQMKLPAIKPGVPASVLANRPDLVAAQLRLREALADVNATRASYYPDLTLTSELGTSSTQLVNLLSNPVAVLGVGLTLPFVQWNTTKLNIRIEEETYKEAVVEFRQTLYEAFQDVENALSARTHYMNQEKALKKSLELAKKAEQVAEIRYRAGSTGVQDWLDQQETRRTAYLALAKNRYNQLTNLMDLYMAIGGDTKTISGF